MLRLHWPMTEISIERLPGIPRIWRDYAAGSKHPLLPAPFDLTALKAHAEQIRNNFPKKLDLIALAGEGILLDESPDSIRRLESADSFAVVTRIYPSLLGGPASQIWKCLMAIKACEEMAKLGIRAVPVGYLTPRSDIPPLSLELLDAESEPRCLSVPPGRPFDLINEIRTFGAGSYDEQVLELIADFYRAEGSFARAELRLLSAITKTWGMVFLDMPALAAAHVEAIAPLQSRVTLELIRERESSLAEAGYPGEPGGDLPEFLVSSFVLPAIAHVIDPHELFSFSGALPGFDELGIVRPLVWPYSGVTLADTRSRKIIEKYGLQIFNLFSDERRVVEHILKPSAADSVMTKLDSLKADVEQMLSEVGEQTGGSDDIEKDRDTCREKILYQIQNLRVRFESARRKREDAVNRQIHRACNLLAPKQRIQESEISGIYFLLRYTQTVLQSVYDRLNASTFQHQLLSME